MITENPFLKRKILVVTAHPDDEAYFAGTLRQVVESGGEVRILCGTLGENGRSYLDYACTTDELKQIRLTELHASAQAIGISQVEVAGYPDGRLSDYVENFVLQIADTLHAWKPDIVLGYGPDGYTGHRDHIAAYTAAMRAAQQHNTMYAAFALPPEPYRTALVGLLQAKRKHGVYADHDQILEANVGVQVDVAFKSGLLRHHASQLQGLDPYQAFGKELGAHVMSYEHFCISSPI